MMTSFDWKMRDVFAAIESLRAACRDAGFTEARASFVDYEDEADAEFGGWTFSGRDALGQYCYANESQGMIGGRHGAR